MLMQERPQCVHIRGALTDQALPATEDRRARLLLDRLWRHKAHLGLAARDDDRLGVSGIVLLTFDEGAHVLRCNQLHLVPERLHLARPVVRAAASLKKDQAGLLPGHEHRELLSRELFTKLDLSCPQRAMDLENILCQIDPDHHILHLAVPLFCMALSTTTLAHCDAVWGGRQPLHLKKPGAAHDTGKKGRFLRSLVELMKIS